MPRSSIEVVRKRGYTAEDVREVGLRGATDDEIIAHAAEEGQIVVTRDTDFGQVLRLGFQMSPTSQGPLVDEIASKIRPILEAHDVVRASLYGSTARGDQKAWSDVDLLVELPPEKNLLDLVALKRTLEEALDRPVHLAEFETIHPMIRERVLSEQVAIV